MRGKKLVCRYCEYCVLLSDEEGAPHNCIALPPTVQFIPVQQTVISGGNPEVRYVPLQAYPLVSLDTLACSLFDDCEPDKFPERPARF